MKIPLEIVETEQFMKDCRSLMTEAEHEDLVNYLAVSRGSGTVIPRTGGLRKMRYGLAQKGKGKRGGSRIIYYYHSDRIGCRCC